MPYYRTSPQLAAFVLQTLICLLITGWVWVSTSLLVSLVRAMTLGICAFSDTAHQSFTLNSKTLVEILVLIHGSAAETSGVKLLCLNSREESCSSIHLELLRV